MTTASCRVLLDADQLGAVVDEIAAAISERYDDGVVLVGLLDGSVVFLGDLVRRLDVSPLIDFLAVSDYAPDSGRVKFVKDLDLDVSGRHVVLVAEIIDTGLTAAFLRASLRGRGAASVELCTLLDRVVNRIVPVPIGFSGREIGDEFVVGYGLGYLGRYRNARALAVVDPDVLAADPDAYVDALYPARAPG